MTSLIRRSYSILPSPFTRVFHELEREMQRIMPSQTSAIRHHRPSISSLWPSDTLSFNSPAVDVSETDSAYQVDAEIPGLSPDQIQLSIEGTDTLVLSGLTEKSETSQSDSDTTKSNGKEGGGTSDVTSTENQNERRRYWTMERRAMSSFRREFTFPHPIDLEKIQAQFKDGVLQVTVPKVVQTESEVPVKKISISKL
jgi:HSP20 family protein